MAQCQCHVTGLLSLGVVSAKGNRPAEFPNDLIRVASGNRLAHRPLDQVEQVSGSIADELIE
jgi:hypothetical protein